MKTRVMFLDDEPQTFRRFRTLLVDRGYDVLTPEHFHEAVEAINKGGVEIIIHGAHRTRTYWPLCQQIFGLYPDFPSLHIATGPEAEEAFKQLKGPFHPHLSPLVSERAFIKQVRRLLFGGRMLRQNALLKKTIKLHHEVDRIFDTLDLRQIRKHTVMFLHQEFKAENVYFLDPGGFSYYLQEFWRVAHLHATTENEKHELIAAAPSTPATLTEVCRQLADDLPRGWEVTSKKVYLASSARRPGVAILPIIGHESRRVLGHLMVVNPVLHDDPALQKVMNHLIRNLGRHFEHADRFGGAKSLTYIDDLTDLFNQRYLKVVLDREIGRCLRDNNCFSVLFMDIDHFKTVNDTKGHRVGSQVLVEVSKILARSIRSTDYGFRYGGDEFILLLVGTATDQAFQIAERIRKEIEKSQFEVDGHSIHLTLSIGIATFPEHANTREQIIEMADRAMYCGKNASRNVVYVAS